ncbi:DUF1768-domain-containing protein [Daldinia sp. FL1419]|nr:DUF1768-domain-containing protein [Daldinia sp. FL1419]
MARLSSHVIHPANDEMESDDIVYYWQPSEPKYGFLSMWYQSPFQDVYDVDIVYPSAQHYFLYHKALLFGERDLANAILGTDTADEACNVASNMENYDHDVWIRERERIAFDANWHKFTAPTVHCECCVRRYEEQGHRPPQFKDSLLATGNRQIIEASPSDRFWGSGYGSGIAWNEREDWGVNMMGIILMRVRDRIRRDEEYRRRMAVEEEEQEQEGKAKEEGMETED